MKGFGEKNQSKKEITSKNKQKVNISQLIKKAFELQSQGKKLEAAKYYVYLIKQGMALTLYESKCFFIGNYVIRNQTNEMRS